MADIVQFGTEIVVRGVLPFQFMAIVLNHTIVPARDKEANDTLTLDFDTRQRFEPHRYTFHVSEPGFAIWTDLLLPPMLLSEPRALQPAVSPIRNR